MTDKLELAPIACTDDGASFSLDDRGQIVISVRQFTPGGHSGAITEVDFRVSGDQAPLLRDWLASVIKPLSAQQER